MHDFHLMKQRISYSSESFYRRFDGDEHISMCHRCLFPSFSCCSPIQFFMKITHLPIKPCFLYTTCSYTTILVFIILDTQNSLFLNSIGSWFHQHPISFHLIFEIQNNRMKLWECNSGLVDLLETEHDNEKTELTITDSSLSDFLKKSERGCSKRHSSNREHRSRYSRQRKLDKIPVAFFATHNCLRNGGNS